MAVNDVELLHYSNPGWYNKETDSIHWIKSLTNSQYIEKTRSGTTYTFKLNSKDGSWKESILKYIRVPLAYKQTPPATDCDIPSTI